MKNLYLLTNSFPFGKGETFLAPEIPYLKKHFNLTIITRNTDSLQTTKLPTDVNIMRYPEIKNLKTNIFAYWLIICSLFDKMFYKECVAIFKSNKFIVQRCLYALRYHSVSISMKNFLEKECKISESILYSYWYNEWALAISKLKLKHPTIKAITRTHGYDLFNGRNPFGRQPFKEQMHSILDKVIFVSEAGKDYYINTYQLPDSEHYPIYRLGCINTYGINTIEHSRAIFYLYSCSNVISLKRIDLIIQSLSLITGFNINWVHFGNGEQMEAIMLLAHNLLDSMNNISFTFKGHQSNEIIHHYLQNNPIDCMITTSSTEGMPVSIQEAFSYGIPVIGTAVGGIPAMITGTGILLSSNPLPREIADAIICMHGLESQKIKEIKSNCRDEWEKKYNANENHSIFAQMLLNL